MVGEISHHKRPRSPSTASAGFTLVEMLVVIAIIGILVALLLPAVQMAREAARRSKCSNTLRQIDVALLNYESANRCLPPGGLSNLSGGYGHSWWVRILPYIEEEEIYNEFDQRGDTTGWLGEGGNVNNRDALRRQKFEFMVCPSNPGLELWALTSTDQGSAFIQSPSYTGIAGAVDDVTARAPKGPCGAACGKISFGGTLIVGGVVHMGDIRDGTSRTIVVSEQGDWCMDENGVQQDCRSDCGCGFTMGPGNKDPYERHYNLTCIMHPIGTRSYSALGVAGNCGPNRPLQSKHSGGVNAAYADGSVQFLSNDTDISVLYHLANRNDGHRDREDAND